MAGGQIRIKVGASLDNSALRIFDPLEKRAKSAAKTIQQSLNAGLSGGGGGRSSRAPKAMFDGLEKGLAKIVAAEQKATRTSEREARQRSAVIEREAKKQASVQAKAARDVASAEDAANKARISSSRELNRWMNQRLREGEQAQAAAVRRAAQAARAGASGGGARRGGGGAIGVGKRAAISVSRGAAISYGLGRSGISGGIDLAESVLEGMGVDLSVASHIGHAQELQQRVTDVVNAGYIPGAAGAQGQLQDRNAVRADVVKAADTGRFDINETAEGLQKFVGLTGDLETGRKILEETATLARATGSGFVEMAEASAEVSNHLGNVPDKAEAIGKVMRIVAGQGKMGALEIKDFARQMAKIAAQAPMFEGSVTQNIGELGLIAQEAKMGGGAASAPQAATSVLAFATALTKGQTLKHWTDARVWDSRTHRMEGLNPFTDSGHTKLRSPEEIIEEALRFSKGDLVKLQPLFGSVMAMRAVKPFASIYSETQGTDDQKIRAVHDEFDRLRKAQLTAEEVQRAYTAAVKTSQTEAQLVNNKLDEMAITVHDAVMPALAGFAPALEKVTPLIAEMAGGIATLLNGLTGADKDKANADAGAVDGKLTSDEDLLNRSKGMQYVPGKGMVPVYDSKVLDTMRAHGATRSAASAELEAQLAKKEEEASGWDKEAGSALHSPLADVLGHAFGLKTAADRASEAHEEAKKMRAELEKTRMDGEQSNIILERIYTEIAKGNALKTAPVVPPPVPGGGVEPPNASGP